VCEASLSKLLSHRFVNAASKANPRSMFVVLFVLKVDHAGGLVNAVGEASVIRIMFVTLWAW
jgi:hypothetical protein